MQLLTRNKNTPHKHLNMFKLLTIFAVMIFACAAVPMTLRLPVGSFLNQWNYGVSPSQWARSALSVPPSPCLSPSLCTGTRARKLEVTTQENANSHLPARVHIRTKQGAAREGD